MVLDSLTGRGCREEVQATAAVPGVCGGIETNGKKFPLGVAQVIKPCPEALHSTWPVHLAPCTNTYRTTAIQQPVQGHVVCKPLRKDLEGCAAARNMRAQHLSATTLPPVRSSFWAAGHALHVPRAPCVGTQPLKFLSVYSNG